MPPPSTFFFSPPGCGCPPAAAFPALFIFPPRAFYFSPRTFFVAPPGWVPALCGVAILGCSRGQRTAFFPPRLFNFFPQHFFSFPWHFFFPPRGAGGPPGTLERPRGAGAGGETAPESWGGGSPGAPRGRPRRWGVPQGEGLGQRRSVPARFRRISCCQRTNSHKITGEANVAEGRQKI